MAALNYIFEFLFISGCATTTAFDHLVCGVCGGKDPLQTALKVHLSIYVQYGYGTKPRLKEIQTRDKKLFIK